MHPSPRASSSPGAGVKHEVTRLARGERWRNTGLGQPVGDDRTFASRPALFELRSSASRRPGLASASLRVVPERGRFGYGRLTRKRRAWDPRGAGELEGGFGLQFRVTQRGTVLPRSRWVPEKRCASAACSYAARRDGVPDLL